MTSNFWPRNKVFALLGMALLYMILGIVLKLSVDLGLMAKLPPSPVDLEITDAGMEINPHAVSSNLGAAHSFLNNNFVKNKGHTILYLPVNDNKSLMDNRTNSEAVSYRLLLAANAKDKKTFDEELEFIKSKMIHPRFGYIMWRLEANGSVMGDGSNMATDADIRAIKALLIAEEQWNDEEYTDRIDQLAEGLEKMAITKDKLLAPYAGVSGEDSTWNANEIWLSYGDFTVFRELSKRRGEPWTSLFENMKRSVLSAQIHNGLYNSMLTESRRYGIGIDGDGYSINSMWIMVRNAESDDPELMASANKSLKFYKEKFNVDAELYAKYSSNGDAMSPSDTPWVYALVGRAAIALDDAEFGQKMIEKLIEKQVTNRSSRFFGAFPEGHGNEQVIGQFTMQESMLTLQDYVNKNPMSKKANNAMNI